jgi:hypothetical protein
MAPETKARTTRKKSRIDGQQPTKEWLSTREAAAYLDISADTLAAVAKKHGLIAAPLTDGGKNLYYKVSSLNNHLSKMALVK